jgi:F-type H+-transporting ATPase subunit alpha
MLKQGQYQPMPAAEQVVAIFSATPQSGRKSWVRDLDLSDIRRYEQEMLDWMRTEQKPLLAKITESGQLGEAEEKALAAALDRFASVFQPSRKLE